MVSGEQPSDRICRKIEILSFPSLSERGPLGSGAFLLFKGERKGVGKVLKALTLLMGHFDPLFLDPSPGSGSGKAQESDFEAISGVFPYPNGSCKKIGLNMELQIYAIGMG